MAIDPETAASSLSDVAKVELRTRQAVRHWISGHVLILWGVLTSAGNIATYLWPYLGWYIWAVVMIAGAAGSFIIVFRYARRAGRQPRDLRILYSMLAFIAYQQMWTYLLGEHTTRELQAFGPSLFMLGFIVAGFWVGRFFTWCGLLITALIVGGYLWAGDWFGLGIAAIMGVGLIAGGVYLLRVGVER